MIITEKVKIRVNNNSIKHLNSKGILNIKVGDLIEINVENLMRGSGIKVSVKCDICNKEKQTTYGLYLRNIGNGNLYACGPKCGVFKYKNTCLEKYGIDSFMKTEQCKEKIKDTCLKKYSKHFSKTNEVKQKIKNTCLEKYGVEGYNLTDEFKEKSRNTCLEKYGVEYVSQYNEAKIKVKKTNLKKYGDECYNTSDIAKEKNKNIYGVEYYSQTTEFKNKWKSTTKDKYGKEYYSQTDEFKNKVKLTCLKNYGVDSPMKNRDIVAKALKSRGLDFESNEYLIYRRKVNNFTKRNKKELFENWNGYDFYDNEYIKDNLVLSWNSGKYPTIDHKISAYDGFKNGISPEEISKIENLCITKKSINSSKNRKSIT